MNLLVKYGSTSFSLEVSDKNFLGVIQPKQRLVASADPLTTVRQALEAPIGTGSLSDIAKRGDKVAIVVDDHTRGTPTSQILPPVLEALQNKGLSYDDITIIFGTGTHRAVKRDEAAKLLGEQVADEIKWVNHDCMDEENLVDLGYTSYKTPVYINKKYLEADLKILTGDVCFHYYAGFGGGRKSVL
ncbi:MAG: lactate racemase domain-containing protein, partial [Candidatus Ranarchaeia archaeon]